MASDRTKNMLNAVNEEYEDNLFRLAVQYAAEKEGNLFFEEMNQSNGKPENQPSQEQIKKYTRRLDAHLKRIKRLSKNRRFPKILNRAAVVVLALIVVFSAAMLTVNAFRVQVLNFLISVEPEYTSLQLEEDDIKQNTENDIVSWTNSYIPTYVPDGYEVSSASYSETIKKIMFSNKQEESLFIIYCEYSSDNNIAVDTENALYIETIKVNGHDGTLFEKDSIITVAWEMANHLYTIQGTISSDELLKMADGVKFIK